MPKLAIFFSGLFFGGTVDHAILALAGRADTPYGIDVGVGGNWIMAGLDLALSVGCWIVHQRFEGRAGSTSV